MRYVIVAIIFIFALAVFADVFHPVADGGIFVYFSTLYDDFICETEGYGESISLFETYDEYYEWGDAVFCFSGIPAGEIEEATFRLYCEHVDGDVDKIIIYEWITDEFPEPLPNCEWFDSHFDDPDENYEVDPPFISGWIEFDITDYVEEHLEDGFIAIRVSGRVDEESDWEVEISSREGEEPPELIIEYVDRVSESFKPYEFWVNIFPNPFNSSCAISAPEGATIKIYDLNGKCLKAFDKTPCVWQPDESIPSGIYLIRATFDGQTITTRAILIR